MDTQVSPESQRSSFEPFSWLSRSTNPLTLQISSDNGSETYISEFPHCTWHTVGAYVFLELRV